MATIQRFGLSYLDKDVNSACWTDGACGRFPLLSKSYQVEVA